MTVEMIIALVAWVYVLGVCFSLVVTGVFIWSYIKFRYEERLWRKRLKEQWKK